MKFHLMTLTFFFFIISITTTAGRSFHKTKKRHQTRVIRTIRVGDLEKNDSRNKFMISASQKFLVRNQVDDVFSWLASAEQLDSKGKRGRFEQFLRFQME